MRASLLLSTLLLVGAANAQVIFQSGLETWNDSVPTDWFGVKTNQEVDSIAQVTTNTHGGTLAIQLINTQNTTRRFTTQPLATDSAVAYDITYWVRGQGEVRIAMFDGRTENSGYSPTTAYEVVSSNTWTQLTATVVCDRTTPAAEFIVYLRNSVAPDHIVLDDVNISVAGVVEPTEASIYAIQFTTDPGGDSPLDGDPVITGGIVTGVDTIGADSYFIQAGTGPYSGIYVFDQTHTVSIGDSVVLTATVDEFNGVTELVSVTEFAVIGQYPVPAPQLLTTATAPQEQWEGVLVIIANAACTALPNGFGEWTINQGSDLLVDDLMYPYTPTVGTNYDVTGCMHYANGAWKLEPRIAEDIVVATSVADNAFGAVAIGPNPTSDELVVRTGVNGSVSYLLTDATGRSVRSGRFTGTTTVDVRGLNAGLYHLTLQVPGGVRTWAVQVVR